MKYRIRLFLKYFRLNVYSKREIALQSSHNIQICCHEIERIASKKEEVFEQVKPTEPYDCITDNPFIQSV